MTNRMKMKNFQVSGSHETGWSISVGMAVLRTGIPTRSQAQKLAHELEELLDCTMTDPECKTCDGVGGCYNCDS